MRALVLFAAAGLLAGCASSTVTLMSDENVKTSGAVAVLDKDSSSEVGQLDKADTMAKVGGKSVRPRAVREDRYKGLMAWMPWAPRPYVLYFNEGTTTLTEGSMPILDALRKVVTADSEVIITGHTDTVGESDFNDKLSLERAAEVRAALVKDGLPVDNARLVGRGERELRVPTADNVSEAGNRRVEVILR
ncbi:MAG: OmpA family protein [Phenylobacterium zucineum]|nr:MAG: OmpA family protein [Phenylobacterium zucineum]